MSEVLVRCDSVGKVFCRDLRRSLWYGMCDIASELSFWRQSPAHKQSDFRQLRLNEFWANSDVSFELKRGECLGLIGRNGAGKTTLLRLLNGLMKPDTGRIELRGRVGAMIALGAGFSPVLTARENVYVNGSILGLSKQQIDDRFDEIIDFAELDDFVDSPVRTFSSGMHVRLGFAVAAILIQPDVLLLDEVLAVGDAGFRSKCYNAIIAMANQAAVILVSHSMPQIARLSSHVLVMSGGEVKSSTDDVAAGIQAYFGEFPRNTVSAFDGHGAQVRSIAFDDSSSVSPGGESMVSRRHDVVIRVDVELEEPLPQVLFVLSFFDAEQKNIARTEFVTTALPFGRSMIRVRVPQFPITPGSYDVQILVSDASDPNRPRHLARYDQFCQIVVTGTVAEYTCTCPILFDSYQLSNTVEKLE